jgi:hypothetical protein
LIDSAGYNYFNRPFLYKMRIKLFAAFLIVGIAAFFVTPADGQVVFQQNFSSSTNLADYVGTGTNQFNAISSSGAGFSWSLNNGRLRAARTGNAGTLARTTDLATSFGAIYQFSITPVDLTSVTTTAITFQVGSGFTTNNSVDPIASTHSRFAINFANTTTDAFTVRDIAGGTNGSGTFTGTQNIFFVVNNTGGSFSYTAPDGSVHAVANDTWDLWVGTSQQFNDAAATTGSVSPTDFKLTYPTGTGSIEFDNFVVTAIPEPSTWIGGALAVAFVAFLQRRRIRLLLARNY